MHTRRVWKWLNRFAIVYTLWPLITSIGLTLVAGVSTAAGAFVYSVRFSWWQILIVTMLVFSAAMLSLIAILTRVERSKSETDRQLYLYYSQGREIRASIPKHNFNFPEAPAPEDGERAMRTHIDTNNWLKGLIDLVSSNVNPTEAEWVKNCSPYLPPREQPAHEASSTLVTARTSKNVVHRPDRSSRHRLRPSLRSPCSESVLTAHRSDAVGRLPVRPDEPATRSPS
jgi:hypothetical protein